MNDNELFRTQVEVAAAFVTATYAFNDEELDAYLGKLAEDGSFLHVIIGIQALLSFTLNKIAQLDGTHSGNLDETTLRKLHEVMLNFHLYDMMDK